MRFQLLAKTMKWGSAMSSLLVSTFCNSGMNCRRAKQYLWACGFVGTALLLNPIVPVFTPADNLMLLLFLVGLSPIVITFAALIDATVTLYPNVITDSYSQGEAHLPTSEWAVV